MRALRVLMRLLRYLDELAGGWAAILAVDWEFQAQNVAGGAAVVRAVFIVDINGGGRVRNWPCCGPCT